MKNKFYLTKRKSVMSKQRPDSVEGLLKEKSKKTFSSFNAIKESASD